MHIINTSAVDVSIHAVSPPLIFSASMSKGAVGAAAAVVASAAGAPGAATPGAATAGTSSAHATGVAVAAAKTQTKTHRDTVIINAIPLCF
jgi:hypothetical protein